MDLQINKLNHLLLQLNQYFELILYSSIAFFIPFLLGHPQWIVGTIVNTSLVLAGLNLKKWQLAPVIILPSIAILARGMLFGPLTIFLIYMIPLIWIGNFLLVYSMKLQLNKFLKLTIGIIAKTGFLALSASILVNTGILPELFLVTMGMMQLYTAIAGGAIALGIQKLKAKS